MVERSAILEQWRNRQDDSAVLATLVRVEGSSYRRPGARMYIHSTGSVGAISGGCLEAEVSRKAGWIAQHGAAIERYSTLFDEILDENNSIDTREIPYGLGCGGVLDVLLEPVSSPEANAMLRALEAAERGETLCSGTILPSAASRSTGLARVILREDETAFFASTGLDAEMLSRLTALASGAGEANAVSIALGNETREVFLEPVLPPQRLVVFGAGDDARPLVRMASLLGWRVTMADGRGWLAQAARFPEADRVLTLSENARNLEQLALSSRDAVALLTHSFEQDRNLLVKLLPRDLRYLGLLGARNRSRLLLTEAASRLGWSPEEALGRVHAPIGLELGGDSPEAVALAIVAQIQAALHHKNAISRGMSTEDFLKVPDRPYIPVQCTLDSPRQSKDSSDPVHAVELHADSIPVPAVLLAAGASTRLGQPKQLMRLPAFGGETLLDHAVALAQASGAAPIFVVLGAHAEEIHLECELLDCILVRNQAWLEGMASSLRVGIAAVLENSPSATGALVMVCDQPGLTAQHLRSLLDAHKADASRNVASHYGGRAGVPAIFPRGMFPALLELQGDQGARKLLTQTGAAVHTIDFPGGELDLDSPEDLQRLREDG